MIIDAHVHLKGGVDGYDDGPNGATFLVAMMDEVGIQKAVVHNLTTPDDNDYLLSECALFPERLTPFVLDYPDSSSLPGISNYVAAGARGIGEIYVRPGSRYTLKTYLEPIVRQARENHLPVLLHTGDYSYTAPAIAAEVIRDNPDINFILGHMGSLNFVLDVIEILKSFPNAYTDTSGMTSHLMLQRAVNDCGAERILFGSDYPFWDPQVELRRIYVTDLGKDAERKILGENAARLLKI